jgi:cholest-4-en-3-one 26-monooxygenase
MHLAKLEMKVQFEEILKRIDEPEFAGPVKYIQSYFVQGVRTMPIRFKKREI